MIRKAFHDTMVICAALLAFGAIAAISFFSALGVHLVAKDWSWWVHYPTEAVAFIVFIFLVSLAFRAWGDD
ncbi:unnamed protein product [marine sediment metagenome]|uniref:Uncharacterized protein n=1 Tax=marine sediment metagenome TaxID=412755 RepID=X0U9T5_9ZZZZ